MYIIIGIIAVYFIALVAISLYAKKIGGSGKDSFILAGRKMTTIMVACSAIGIAVGGTSTIGVAESAFGIGISAGWYNMAYFFAFLVVGFLGAAQFRRMGIATVPEFFERFYDKTSKVAVAIILAIVTMAICALQYMAGGSILASLLPQVFTLQTGTIVSAIAYISITFMGGMMAIGLTNILNVVLIYGGIVTAAVMVVNNAGGISALQTQLPPEIPYFSFVGIGWPMIISWVFVMVSQCMASQAFVQVAVSADSPRSAKRGYLIAALVTMPAGFICAAMGMAAKVLYPDIVAQMALPTVIMSLPPFIAGITLAALWAANVSTACGLLLGTGTLITNDLYRNIFNPNMTEDHFNRLNKIVILVVGVLAFIASQLMSGILNATMVALALLAPFSIVIVATLYLPQFCRKCSSINTIIAGIVSMLIWMLIPQSHFVPHLVIFEYIICIPVFALTAVFNRNSIVVTKEQLGIESHS